MANRSFNPFRKSLEKEIVDLFAKVTVGGTGAPTLVAAESMGVKSITRTGAGAYDIVLGTGSNMDVYNKLKAVYVTFVNATAPAAPLVYVVSESVVTPSTGKISIQFTDKAQSATDPGSGEVLKFQIVVKNSTAI